MNDFEEYRDNIISDIEATVGERECQPIIFAGSGLSMRYFSAPSWDELLQEMAGNCPKLEQNYGYYRQTRDEREMGQHLADQYARWAWDKNESKFENEDILDYKRDQDIFIKSEISKFFRDLTPNSTEELSSEHPNGDLTVEDAEEEIQRLRDIQPHAVITTNYDQFLERIFNHRDTSEEDNQYEVVVGEKVLETQYKSIGEILKIHGSSTEPESLILTSDDYAEFNERKRYLSSKMVTYFSEHPLLIVGYSATDTNVQKILSWVNDVLSEGGDIADDIYFVEFERNVEDRDVFQTEKRIPLTNGNSITVKRIVANHFDWVFEAFASGDGFEADIRYLRKLVANMYEVVRNREPRAKVVDHQQLEEIATNEDELATVLGISAVGDSPGVEFNHNYSPEEAADAVGLSNSTSLNSEVIDQIRVEKGTNITKFNNIYHVAFFAGRDSVEPRRYSEEAIELFNNVLNNEDYELRIPSNQIPANLPSEHGITFDESD